MAEIEISDDDTTTSLTRQAVDPELGLPPLRIRTLDFDPEKENNYVIVVHGTFDSPPRDGMPTWYQPPLPGEHNFCSKLAKLLNQGAIRGSSVWRAFPGPVPKGIPYPFHWDGSNTHKARVDAATKLRKLIDRIGKNDPAARIHFVAHSHGGNVVLKAVELYMQDLQKRDWRPPVEEDWVTRPVDTKFWESCREEHDSIKEWRRVDMPIFSLLPLLPFLIIWRGEKGQMDGRGATYPWGYYRWWDSLLGLGAARQRLFLQQQLVTSPITNPLGAFVFLGTPFFVKKWHDWGLPFLVLSTLLTMTLTYLMITLYVFLWRIICQQNIPHSNSIGEFISDNTVVFALGAGISAFVLGGIVLQTTRTARFWSGNLYHHVQHGWSPAMSALVVHAGKLDEASLALSTEPVIRAYVFPALTRFLKKTPWQPLPPRPSKYARRIDWFAFFFNCFVVLLWNIIFLIPSLLMSAVSYVVAPIVTSAIQKFVVSAIFGLAEGELNFAYVYVDECLELPRLDHQIEHWNVQKLLAQAKACSLRGTMIPGYEDDTVEQPEWLGLGNFWSDPGSGNLRRTSSGTSDDESAARPGLLRTESLKKYLTKLLGEQGIRVTWAKGSGEAGAEKGMSRNSASFSSLSQLIGDGSQRMTPDTATPVDSRSSCRRPTNSRAHGLEEYLSAATPPRPGCRRSGTSTPPCMSVAKADEQTARERPWQPGASTENGEEDGMEVGQDSSVSGDHHLVTVDLGEDKAKLMVPKPPPVVAPLGGKLIYDFLWDEEALEREVGNSRTYELLRDQRNKIDRNPRLTEREFEQELKKLVLIIEERLAELTGRVDINHGAYFRDPRILRAIAYFLTNHRLPEWSRELDADISKLDVHLGRIMSFRRGGTTGTGLSR